MRDIELRSEPVVGKRMKTIGVDWGPKGIILVHREGNYGVYKVPGHKAWAGNYQPWRYHAASYGIVKITEGSSAHRWGYIDPIYESEVTPGASWRSALKNLKIEVHGLACTTTLGELVGRGGPLPKSN